MDFQELHQGTDCDCIATASQNCSDTFSRKISGNSMKDKHFRITKKNQEAAFIDCEKHCDAKSLSIDIWNEESNEFLKEYHNKNYTSSIAPKLKENLLIFKIKQYGGFVKSTPRDHNKFHYSYYKPDSFSTETCLDFVQMVKLTSNAV